MHDHSHHAPANFSRAFIIGILLNFGFVILETVFGLLAHSMALVADAGHNLSDVLALLLAWGATVLARKSPTEYRTFGWRSSTIFAAMVNAVLLLVTVGAIAWEAILHLFHPAPVAGETVIWVAAIGIGINMATALLFLAGRKRDLNIRSAYLHMVADAAISAGVVIAGFLILETGWVWVDPLASLMIAIIIIAGTWGLLRESLDLALQAVPPGIDMGKVREYLAGLPHVLKVNDLHVWGMSTTDVALTAHLVRDVNLSDDALLERAAHDLHEHFGIGHTTLQFGTEAHNCGLETPAKDSHSHSHEDHG